MDKRKGRVALAIDRLAALYEYGALQASMEPDKFLDNVAAELSSLRRVLEAAEKHRRMLVYYRERAGRLLTPACSLDDIESAMRESWDAIDAHRAEYPRERPEGAEEKT